MLNNKKMVVMENIALKYHSLEGETQALKNISFTVGEGEFVGIVGPSGCGKTTILSLIAGLLEPTKGQVLVDEKVVKGPSTDVGYMLQQDYLFEWRNIMQNVLLGLEVHGNVTEESIAKAEQLIDIYGLGEFKNHYPDQLSGGMRQRAALIRTLAINPKILLLDEPFSALDYQTRLAMSDEVSSIISQEKKTALLVTHDIAEAISMSNRVFVLSERPAIIKSIHEIKLTSTADNPISRRQAPEFRQYFNTIWKELDINVQ